MVSKWKWKLYDPSDSLRVRLGLSPLFKNVSGRDSLLWREKRCPDELGNGDNVGQHRNNGGGTPLPCPDNDETNRPSKIPRLLTSDAIPSDEINVVQLAQTSDSAALLESQVLVGNRDDAVTPHTAVSVVSSALPVEPHEETHPTCEPSETRTG